MIENQVIQGDCLEVMPTLPDQSIGMILADLPYGVTACHWDQVIPLDRLWEQFKRLIQPKRAIVLTATQPFTTDLINSNREWFKYCWVWDKVSTTSGFSLDRSPARCHEDILVFGFKTPMYNPQMRQGVKWHRGGRADRKGTRFVGRQVRNQDGKSDESEWKYPKSIIQLSNANQSGKINPTQKPIALFEYLIRTYTNEGDIVLDPTAGSFTTAIACLKTNRRYICIEKDPDYFRKGCDRIQQWHDTPKQIALPIETPSPQTAESELTREQLTLFSA